MVPGQISSGREIKDSYAFARHRTFFVSGTEVWKRRFFRPVPCLDGSLKHF